jgi:hypothetical protein
MCLMNYTMPPRRGPGFWFLLVPFFLAGTMFVLFSMHVHTDAPATAVLEVPAAAPQVYEPQQSSDPSEVLLADVYPSQKSAIAALSRKLTSAIMQVESNPQSILVSGPDDSFEARRIRNLLSRDFPSANITDKAEGVNDDNAVKLNLEIATESFGKSRRSKAGKVQIGIEGAVARTSLSAAFIDRPWAADPAAYINDHPDRNVLIGRCGNVATSEPEARRAAEEDAVRQAAILIQQREFNRGKRFNGDSIDLVSDVRRTLPIKDRFVQKFHRPYGDVWSESVLVDASSGWLDSMSQRHAAAMYQHETRSKRTAASALIVLITILIAYLFLNAVTKSYFTARLRFMAILFAVGVMVVAMGIIARA